MEWAGIYSVVRLLLRPEQKEYPLPVTAVSPANLDTRALDILHRVWGYGAFRGVQADIVRTVAAGENALVLMPTGGGKSLCYQVPSLLRRGPGGA